MAPKARLINADPDHSLNGDFELNHSIHDAFPCLLVLVQSVLRNWFWVWFWVCGFHWLGAVPLCRHCPCWGWAGWCPRILRPHTRSAPLTTSESLIDMHKILLCLHSSGFPSRLFGVHSTDLPSSSWHLKCFSMWSVCFSSWLILLSWFKW